MAFLCPVRLKGKYQARLALPTLGRKTDAIAFDYKQGLREKNAPPAVFHQVGFKIEYSIRFTS
jgi:hypothetical protein